MAGADDPTEVQTALLLAQAVLGGAGVLRVGDAAARRQGVARAAGVAVAAHAHNYYRLSSKIYYRKCTNLLVYHSFYMQSKSRSKVANSLFLSTSLWRVAVAEPPQRDQHQR